MNISAEKYDLNNHNSQKAVEILLNKIKSFEDSKRSFDLILDIGCGTGNVTTEIVKNINYNRLIGVDIDRQMIEYAEHNYKRDGVEYLQCDIQQQWDEMSDQVKQMKNKCALIFTILTLHWITDIESCAKNISNLLAPGSRLYVLMVDVKEAYKPTLTKQAEFETDIPLMKDDNFVNIWKKAFKNCGLEIEMTEQTAFDEICTKEFAQNMLPSIKAAVLKNLIKSCHDDCKGREIFKKHEYVVNSLDNVKVLETVENGLEKYLLTTPIVCLVAKKKLN